MGFFWLLVLFSIIHSNCHLLSEYASSDYLPWIDSPAWSRRLFPVFTSLRPKDLALGFQQRKNAPRVLPSYMASLSASFAPVLASACKNASISIDSIFEVYPSYDDDNGFYTWVYARYSEDNGKTWAFLPFVDNDEATLMIPPAIVDTAPIFPLQLNPLTDASEIFEPAYKLNDLYAQPFFGNCIWVSNEDGNIISAWLDPENVTLVKEMRSTAVSLNLTW